MLGILSPVGASGTVASLPSTSPAGGFMDLVNNALQNVSSTQANAATAETGFATGQPGATLSRALVASDHAEIAWNATVAVRNEIVTAYQSIMNMQF
ncbi:MAG: flagellar hook-basal body complex protein FliE [Acidocella sp.]|nr:flagellar hook-basal body complex protein FliE [Acidocella sp.]